jgi:hypothetical protein
MFFQYCEGAHFLEHRAAWLNPKLLLNTPVALHNEVQKTGTIGQFQHSVVRTGVFCTFVSAD